MSMMKHPREWRKLHAGVDVTLGCYDIAMRLSVEDSALLWRAAAAHAFSFMDCTDLDIEDMLGPMEDPSVADCIAMLVGPRDLDGCRFDAFSIVSAEAAIAQKAGQTGSRRTRKSRTPHHMRLESGSIGGLSQRKPPTRP